MKIKENNRVLSILEENGIVPYSILNYFESNMSCFWKIRSEQGDLFIKKPFLFDPTLELSVEERKWVEKVSLEFPSFRWRERPTSKSKILEREVETLGLWNENNVPSPKYLFSNESLIVMKYIEGRDYKQLLEEDTNYKNIGSLINTYQFIRHCALEKNDLRILHADPKLKNFMNERGECIAVDPANILRGNENIKNLDSYLNLYFLYSVYSLDTDDNTKLNINKEIVDSFEKEEQDRLKELNQELAMARSNFPVDFRKYKYSFDNYSPKYINMTRGILEHEK